MNAGFETKVLSEGYDFGTLRGFMKLFPSASLARFIRGYFWYHSIPLEEDEEDADGAPVPTADQNEAFDIMLVRFSTICC